MAWEHSYSAEAYSLAHVELETWSCENLAEALSAYNFTKNEHEREWGRDSNLSDDQDILAKLPHDILMDACMDAIEDVRLCSNGGHRMYIDFEGWYQVELSKGELA